MRPRVLPLRHHRETLLNEFDPGDLIVVDRKDQASVLTRPKPEDLAQWLEEYTLGELWEKNILGGRPGR